MCPRLQPDACQAALPGLALNHMAAAPRAALLAQLENPWAVIMLGRIFEVALPQTPDPTPNVYPTPTPTPTPNPNPTPTPNPNPNPNPNVSPYYYRGTACY